MAQRRNDPHRRPVRRQPASRPDQPMQTVSSPRQMPAQGMPSVDPLLTRSPNSQKNRPNQKVRQRRITRGEMRRRRRRRRMLTCGALALLVILGVVLSVTVLFKVSAYRVENPNKVEPVDTGIYSEEAILSALGVPMGVNLFDFSLREKEQQMALALPYLETIQLRRSLPGTLVIRVTPAREAYQMRCAGGWAVLSQGLKVLKVQPEEPQGLLSIEGMEPLHPAAGMPLVLDLPVQGSEAPGSASQEQSTSQNVPQSQSEPETQTTTPRLDTLEKLLAGLEPEGLIHGVCSIDLSDLNEITFVYENRVRVLLGTINTLDYKMEWARYILLNQKGDGLQHGDRGRLDISHVRADGSIQPLFTPGPMDPEPPTVTPDPNAVEPAAPDAQGDAPGDPQHDPSQE